MLGIFRQFQRWQARKHATAIYNEMIRGLNDAIAIDPALRPCGMTASIVLLNNPQFKPAMPGNVLNFVRKKGGSYKVEINPLSSYNAVISQVAEVEIFAATSVDNALVDEYLEFMHERLDELFAGGNPILNLSVEEQEALELKNPKAAADSRYDYVKRARAGS